MRPLCCGTLIALAACYNDPNNGLTAAFAGTLTGTVTSNTGSALPSVNVTANPELGTAQTVTANGNGVARVQSHTTRPSDQRRPHNGSDDAPYQGGPNQEVNASVSPTWVRSPTQATYPSGRTKTPVGAETAPITGTSQGPAYLASMT